MVQIDNDVLFIEGLGMLHCYTYKHDLYFNELDVYYYILAGYFCFFIYGYVPRSENWCYEGIRVLEII